MIKKRKNWYRGVKPYAPHPPTKPEPTVTYSNEEVLYTSYGGTVRLKDVPLPEGKSLADVYVCVSSVDEDGDVSLEFGISEEVTVPNPNYKKLLSQYETALKQYKKRKAAHKEELEAWTQWNKEQEEEELRERLQAAEHLLLKHGRLKKDKND